MMRIELVKRPQPSKLFSALSPLLALSLTLVFGAIAFALMGKEPLHALYVFFVEPLFDIWSWHELLVKAAPLILIAVGLCVCFLSNNWNIGAEGQFIAGAIAGSVLPVMFPDVQSWLVLPLMMLMGMAGGAAYASIPALLKVRFNTNEILTSLMLVYVARCSSTGWCAGRGATRKAIISRKRASSTIALFCRKSGAHPVVRIGASSLRSLWRLPSGSCSSTR